LVSGPICFAEHPSGIATRNIPGLKRLFETVKAAWGSYVQFWPDKCDIGTKQYALVVRRARPLLSPKFALIVEIPSFSTATGLWVLKKGCVKSEVSGCEYHSEEEFLARVRKLGGYWELWPWSLTEEADEPFDILGSRRQEELLPNKL
jgi:hypothetical protein